MLSNDSVGNLLAQFAECALVGEIVSQNSKPVNYGKGINSIPVRFCILSLALSAVCVTTLTLWFPKEHSSFFTRALIIASTIVIPALVTFAAARKLIAQIDALKQSTEAIAAGDVTRPVAVDCVCEVGGLAQSFQKMVNRLNDNIVRMNTLAHTDPVTGLPNRTVINHILALASSRGPDGCCGSLFFIDLDNFKAVNDSLGHDCGDELLRQVSRRVVSEAFGLAFNDLESCTTTFGELCETCPENVVFARFAGDEFVAVVPQLNSVENVVDIASRITAALKRPFNVFGHDVRIGVSVGIARSPIDTKEPNELLRLADIAMFCAKKNGKNCYVMFDERLRGETIERSQLEADLRQAIANGDISLHYQAKFDARTLRLAGVEALARWSHGMRGEVPPSKFIPIAEEAGLMPALGRLVFELALQQSKKWQDKHVAIPIAVNVSAAQFDDVRFVPDLLDLLKKHRVSPQLIEIEITESTLMSDFAMAATRINALRDANLLISIDDFGVGFSNLSQLAKLPVNQIKLDRSLVEAVGADHKAEAIIHATIGMAHALGLMTVAEGIETNEQAEFLKIAGCNTMQGYLFARPMPVHEFEYWMERHGHRLARMVSEHILKTDAA